MVVECFARRSWSNCKCCAWQAFKKDCRESHKSFSAARSGSALKARRTPPAPTTDTATRVDDDDDEDEEERVAASLNVTGLSLPLEPLTLEMLLLLLPELEVLWL